MTNRKKRWEVTELINMTIMYYQGFSNHEISMVLSKTPSSINKKMDRLQIKPNKDPQYSYIINRHIPCDLNLQEMNDHIALIRKKLGIDDGESLESVIQKMTHHYPLQSIPKRTGRLFEEQDDGIDHQWKSLEQICQFLHQNHIFPKKIKDITLKKKGFSHILKGECKRPGGLLIEANKINRSQNRDIYYLTDCTLN